MVAETVNTPRNTTYTALNSGLADIQILPRQHAYREQSASPIRLATLLKPLKNS